jgi:hypothetical protein
VCEAVAVKAVEKLLMSGEFPVEGTTPQIFFPKSPLANQAAPDCARAFASGFACLAGRDA